MHRSPGRSLDDARRAGFDKAVTASGSQVFAGSSDGNAFSQTVKWTRNVQDVDGHKKIVGLARRGTRPAATNRSCSRRCYRNEPSPLRARESPWWKCSSTCPFSPWLAGSCWDWWSPLKKMWQASVSRVAISQDLQAASLRIVQDLRQANAAGDHRQYHGHTGGLLVSRPTMARGLSRPTRRASPCGRRW